MGFNISEVSGNSTGGLNDWTFTIDLTSPGVTSISGDFDVVPILGGAPSEATDGYTFSALSTTQFGSIVVDETDGTFTFTVDRAAVMASGSDQVVTFTVTGTSGAQSDEDNVAINILICVARGTRIATVAGPRRVETLRPGDLVVVQDGPPRPVRWIGSRRLTEAELTADPSLRPIRIAAHALGPEKPARDLVVSPQHRVLLSDWRAELMFGEPEVLVPAKGLVNDTTIRIDYRVRAVEYFHLLFDRHEIILTEDAPTESFHPGPYTLSTMATATRTELIRLFPELAGEEGLGPAARPSLKVWETRVLEEVAAAPAIAAE